MQEVIPRFDETKYMVKIYNACYGGGPARLRHDAQAHFDSLRGNVGERLLQTLEKFGTTYTTRHTAKFGVCLCPIECEPAFTVREYDGYESPYINKDEYLKILLQRHFKEKMQMTRAEYEDLLDKSQSAQLVRLTFKEGERLEDEPSDEENEDEAEYEQVEDVMTPLYSNKFYISY